MLQPPENPWKLEGAHKRQQQQRQVAAPFLAPQLTCWSRNGSGLAAAFSLWRRSCLSSSLCLLVGAVKLEWRAETKQRQRRRLIKLRPPNCFVILSHLSWKHLQPYR